MGGPTSTLTDTMRQTHIQSILNFICITSYQHKLSGGRYESILSATLGTPHSNNSVIMSIFSSPQIYRLAGEGDGDGVSSMGIGDSTWGLK